MHTRWARRILIAISVVVALFGVAIVLLLTIDLGGFKSNLEDYVSNSTGREFVIAGRFEPSIGRTVDLVAEDVRLANADWGVAENILELESLVVSVDTWSLLSGPIEVLNLEVEGLTLHVEKEPETQQSSWKFGDAPPLADDDETREPFELPLWLEQARLQKINITFGQGWLDARRNIRIDDANLSEDERELLVLTLAGAVGDDLIRAEGLIGPLPALLNGQGPRWELQVSIGKLAASTKGSFRNLFSLEGPDIHAQIQGPLAENFLNRFALPLIAHGPVDLTGALTEGPDGINLQMLGAFGDLTTNVVGRAQSLATIGDLDLSLDVRGPDLQAISALFGAEFLPATEFSVVGGLTIAGDILDLQSMTITAGAARLAMTGRLAPEAEDPDALLNLSANGPAIRDFLPLSLSQRIPSAAFEVEAVAVGSLRQPQLRVITARIGDHEASADGILPMTSDLAGLDVAITANGPDINAIAGPWVDRELANEAYSVKARLGHNGNGFEIRELDVQLESASLMSDGTTGTLPDLAGMDLSVKLRGQDLQAMLQPWVQAEIPAMPFELEGDVRESDGALRLTNISYRIDDVTGTLDGTTGRLPSLEGLRLTSLVTGPNTGRFADLLTEFVDPALLTDADFELGSELSRTAEGWFVDPWRLRIGDSQLEVRGGLGNLSEPAGIDIEFTASGPDLRHFLPDRGIDVPVPYSANGGMRFTETEIALEEIDIRVARTTAWLHGTLPASAKLTDAEFDLRIAGPDLERIGRALGVENLPPHEYRFEGSLQRSGDSYAIDNLVLVIGENDFSGTLDIEIGEKPKITGKIESNSLNLTELSAAPEETTDSDENAPKADRLIPDTPLPLDALDIAVVDLSLRLRQLKTRSLGAEDIKLDVSMDSNELHVRADEVSLSYGGTLTGALDIVRSGVDQAEVAVDVVAQQFRLRPRLDDDGSAIDRPQQDLDLKLSGSGRTLRDLAASANGKIKLRLGAGEIDNNFSGFVLRDMLSQVFAAVNPFAKESKYTQLNCGFAEIDVVDGVANSRAVGLQTDKLAAASVGTVDLATEALDLSFRVKHREGVGVSLAGAVNPFVKVGGTLASPALTIDTKRGVISGTVAVLTGGLSILYKGVFDRYLSRDDYCEAVIEALDAGEIPAWEGPATSEK